jgi:hypothetical protein
MCRIMGKTVCTAQTTTESRNTIAHTLHDVVEKQNPYQSENQRRRPEPTPASVLCVHYNVPYLSRTAKALDL